MVSGAGAILINTATLAKLTVDAAGVWQAAPQLTVNDPDLLVVTAHVIPSP